MKIVRIPLFWKFTIAIIFIVSLFGSINVLLIWNNVFSNLDSELESRGLFIARSIAAGSVEGLMYDDPLSLQKLLDDVLVSDKNIRYVFITRNNIIIAHTFEDGVPGELFKSNVLNDSVEYSSVLITPRDSGGVIIKDVAVPILNSSVGTVRIGISETEIRSKVNETIHTLLFMVAVFLALGILGAFVFSYIITNPVKLISNKADNLDLDQLGKSEFKRLKIRQRSILNLKYLIQAEDEIDLLTEKFNNMLDRLERTYSELKKAESSLIQSEKLASIGTLVSGLAHEINNPISGIQNCLRRIEKDPSNKEQNVKYHRLMKEAADVIENIIRELLNFSRKSNMEFQSVDLNMVIEKSLQLVGHRLEKERIEITKESKSQDIEINGSAQHLEQVFVNLFLNSIDAITEKKNTEVKSSQFVKIIVKKLSGIAEITVEDSGTGIRDSDLNRIFDPFFTSKETGKGTGLGLSVTYNILKQHSGDISVESTFGTGTKFRIILPLNSKL